MPAVSDLHVVLGAGGAVGGSVLRELVSQGHRVRAVNRSGRIPALPGVEVHQGDITTPAGAKTACDGAHVVYHCAAPAYDRWVQEFPHLTDAVSQGAAAAGAKLVFADNLYMYGPVSSPMTEDMPYAARNPKGRVRAEMAQALLAAHRSGSLRVAIGRAPDYYGPGGVNTIAGTTVFAAALGGKVARWVGPLDQPHSLSYLPDIAKGLVLLGNDGRADGQAWHLPAAPPVTGRQFLDLVFAELGRPGRTAALGRPMQRIIGMVNPTVRALGETWYQRERPFVADASKFTRTFGPFIATPHANAIAATLDWYRANLTP
ncbi:NAD-dependent epimerase/dehydratase family protein [Nonomuraea sp. NEAU-A123]|uniref:NAD-dependent epimerase/dehydratase family protein n=1 Tax=Nonomuraea sp. NEAU-A123 TaxID=2839649 RepID=UPI001BE45E79|nr:NAD-dependent epimerase/dehydratase family protein [Nonomuraea sp. NEAU-A123]MBT2227688.1 NAD-dependent epimerase/dehydratase family protein [Nonomuraea sp. NEAU-A123]